MGLLIPCFVPRGRVLYTMIVPGGRFLPPSSRVLGGLSRGGMVLDEIDTCITRERFDRFQRHTYLSPAL